MPVRCHGTETCIKVMHDYTTVNAQGISGYMHHASSPPKLCSESSIGVGDQQYGHVLRTSHKHG